MIDEPQVMDPLSTFDEIVEEKEEEAAEEEAEEKKDEAEDEGKDQEEEQEKEQDDYDKLDPEIRAMIDAKVKETTEVMEREVETRK